MDPVESGLRYLLGGHLGGSIIRQLGRDTASHTRQRSASTFVLPFLFETFIRGRVMAPHSDDASESKYLQKTILKR